MLSGGFGNKIIIFGADINSSAHVDNKNKEILILDKGTTQGLDDATLTSEVQYYINFTKQGKKFCLNLYYSGSNSCLFANGIKIYQFKSKESELFDYLVRLENISKEFSVADMKQTGLNEYEYDSLVGFKIIDVDDILDIHKYLMKRNDIK